VTDVEQMTPKELVEYVAGVLVDHPEEVRVRSVEEEGTINIELRVARPDMPKVIGRGGQVANALRTLVGVIAARHGKRSRVDIV
jgi:predicted RNA-binding protein YlqC (UPF0109 family)